MTLWRAYTVAFFALWLVGGVAFVANHEGVADLGGPVVSAICYVLLWRCVNCRSYGSTVKLVLSKEEKRARRDPATTLAMVLTGAVALWESAIIVLAPGSYNWLTYSAMLAAIPAATVVAFVSERRSRTSSD